MKFDMLPPNFRAYFNWLNFDALRIDPAHANLVFDLNLDVDSLAEILDALEKENEVQFNINLSDHYPGVYSFYYSEFLMGLFPKLKERRLKKYLPITIADVWHKLNKSSKEQ